MANSVLIKPASGSCNMRCAYCFYEDETKCRETASYGMMSLETLETVVRETLAFGSGACSFAFQGGEPTLAGLVFFRKLPEFVEKWNRKRRPVSYAIQTNGTLLDREWVEYFSANHFLVGLSLDGSKETHDLHRLDASGGGTYSKVMHAAQLLRAGEVPFNILTVVTAPLARNIRRVYPFYKRNGFFFQQYIPCLDPLGEERGLHPYSLTPQIYGEFLCALFDLWYEDIANGTGISIRWFDNLVGMLAGIPPESCGMLGTCSLQSVIEADGSVYPCDFYVLDEYRMGNLNTTGYAGLDIAIGKQFIEASRHQDPACAECKWRNLCRGGCRRDREPMQGGVLSLNDFCPAFQTFFAYAFPRLSQLSRRVRR